jgi:hypothetical protein
MRALVFFLVLANVVLWAWNTGYLGQPGNPDAARLAQQVKPEAVRIVGHGVTPPPANGKAAKAAEPPEELCLVWERLAPADADGLAVALAEKFPGVRAERRTAGLEGGDWWVHVPPQAAKADADRKAGELKQLGVSDYYVVPEGPNRFAISLGVFSNEKGAQERLAELRAKGVKTARVVRRNGKESLASLEVRGPWAMKAEVEAAAAGIVPDKAGQACR